MPQNVIDIQDMGRQRPQLFSPGHNPPRFVDKTIPSYMAGIRGIGGPGKQSPRTQGTNPWIAGSMTIGSNRLFHVTFAKFASSSANVHFLLRHNHSGSTVTPFQLGTLDDFYLAAAGQQAFIGDADTPLHSIPAGTLFIYGVGAGSTNGTSSNRVFKALPASPGSHRFSAILRGYIA